MPHSRALAPNLASSDARTLTHHLVRLVNRFFQILRYRCADPAVLELKGRRQLGALEPNSSSLLSAPLTSQHLLSPYEAIRFDVAVAVGELTVWELARAAVSRSLKGGGSNREDRGGGEGEVRLGLGMGLGLRFGSGLGLGST